MSNATMCQQILQNYLAIHEFSENLNVHTDRSNKLGEEQSEILSLKIVGA